MVRSGFVDNYNNLSEDKRVAMSKIDPYKQLYVGVEVSEEMVDFLHDNYFAAVVGDAPAFESWPSPHDWNHHGYLLPRWGCPIGEMWDLEKLSETCKKYGRHHFFMTSSPANVIGEFHAACANDQDTLILIFFQAVLAVIQTPWRCFSECIQVAIECISCCIHIPSLVS